MNFNDSKHTYRELVDNSIKFSGKDVEFFAAQKAGLLTKAIRQFIPNITKPKILDVGCGHGYIHRHLPNDVFDVVGVETAAEVLDLAKQYNPDVTYLSYDGRTLPFAAGSFDVVIAICVMHHVRPEQWNTFLAEMKRVIKPGGIAVIFEHNPFNPVTRVIVANNILDDDAVLVSSHKLKKLMLQAGFEKVANRFIFFTPFAARIFRWLDKMLWWCPAGAQYYSVATY